MATNSVRFVMPLAGTSERVFREVGSKAANLGEMIGAGLPVPEGFVVTTDAYREFVRSNGLGERMEGLLRGVAPDDTSALDAASEGILSLFAGARMPVAVAEAVTEACSTMDGAPVAVRSSSTAEDLPGTSFAGQYDTYLNVSGTEAVLENVKRCWASLWNARAVSYRIGQGIPQDEDLALAVVVQRLADADRAGVLFTANPLDGRRDVAMINSSWGLGESVVSGDVTPDQFFVEKRSGRVLEERIACKLVMTARSDGGSVSRPVEPGMREKRSLSDGELRALCELALTAERHFGCPQDIEWAIERDRPFLVQARPMTTLFPTPEPPPDPADGPRLYVCFNRVFQGISDPITPMGLEMLRTLSAMGGRYLTGRPVDLHPRWFKTAGGRVYLDVTAAFRWPALWKQAVKRFDATDGVAGKAIYEYLEVRGDRYKQGRRIPGIPPGVLRTELRMTGKMLFALTFHRLAKRRGILMADRTIAELERGASSLTDNRQRVEYARERCMTVYESMATLSARMGPAMLFADAVKGWLERWFGSSQMFEPVLQALPDNPTTDMGEKLIFMARSFKERGETPAADSPEIRRFLETYGHRAMTEIDMGVERWSEDPTYVVNIVVSYMDNVEAKIAMLRENELEALRAVDGIVAGVRREKGPVRAWVVKWMLSQIRELTGQREMPKFQLVRALAVFRRMFQEGGGELAAAGALDDPDDIFFLTFDDVCSEADLRAKAAEGRRRYAGYLKIRSVPRFLTEEGECIYGPREKTAGGGMEGVSVSTGVYEGTARVIDDPRGAKLERGEVLVTHSTDPSWTPLFLNAGALVMESGGTGSHGGIVAREYGIPAVSGIEGVTARIRTGQRVRVNGDTGELFILGEQGDREARPA